MKDQYFGDVNDYRKYGLLRLLSGNDRLKTAVCWMLTSPDQRPDGKFIDYLRWPSQWRKYDPPLFDLLLPCLQDPAKRQVSQAEAAEIVPQAIYHSLPLTDSAPEREHYFRELTARTQSCEWVFFDPDNGLEVKSTPYGKHDSCKYIYWRELQQVWAAGKSLLVYQHFPREEREGFIRKVVASAFQNLDVPDIVTYRTAWVVFILMSQARHQAHFRQQSEQVSQRWGEQIQVEHWPRA